MTVRISMSREDIDGMYDLASEGDREKVRKVLCTRVKAIQKRQAAKQKVRSRRATHGNGFVVLDFLFIASFKKLSEATIALKIMSQKDHMAHLTRKREKYELWSRVATC